MTAICNTKAQQQLNLWLDDDFHYGSTDWLATIIFSVVISDQVACNGKAASPQPPPQIFSLVLR